MSSRRLGVAVAMLTVSLSPGAFAQILLCSNGAQHPLFATGLVTGATTQSGVAAPAGERWSENANPTGDTTQANAVHGLNCGSFRCADDFRVPIGPDWTVSRMVNFAYLPDFAGPDSPMVSATVQIFGPCPGTTEPGDAGCSVIAGDTTTNRLTSSLFSNTYRVSNTLVPPPIAPVTTRRIWRNELTLTPAVLLSPGRYWFDFQITAAGGLNFTPPIAMLGVRTLPTFNGVQKIDPAPYAAAIDMGRPATAPDVVLDLPFEVHGTGPAQAQCIDTIFADGFD
jgi:hypothetical protein